MMPLPTHASLGAAATLACIYEATARKPGNVYPGADFDETTTYAAFVKSAIAIGPDLETAFLRMEVLEHYARILTIARGGVGEPAAMSETARAKCLELRKAAGLHREAAPVDEMRRVVMEEVRRALGGEK